MRDLTQEGEADLVTVVVPEIVPHKWWEHLLHNKTALYIRTAFLFKPGVVVTAVPYRLGSAVRLRDRINHDEMLDTALAADRVALTFSSTHEPAAEPGLR